MTSTLRKFIRFRSDMVGIGTLLGRSVIRPAGVRRLISRHLACRPTASICRRIAPDLKPSFSTVIPSQLTAHRPLCTSAAAAVEAPAMAGTLEHSSYANAAEIVVTHNDFVLDVKFETKTIKGSVKVCHVLLSVCRRLQAHVIRNTRSSAGEPSSAMA